MALFSTARTGLILAASGAAHFAKPEVFEQLTTSAFPDDTRNWVYRNGATEVGIGLAMMGRKTRKLGVIALLGYVGFLGSRVASAQ